MDRAAQRRSINDAKLQLTRESFPAVAEEWLAAKRKMWASETVRKATFVLDRYLIPALRAHRIESLSTKDAAKVIMAIGEHAPNLAAKARQYLGGIVTYSIQQGLRDDGRLLSLRGTVPTAGKGHIPAATSPGEIALLVKAIAEYDSPVTRSAL